jgi:hypothetical protein
MSFEFGLPLPAAEMRLKCCGTQIFDCKGVYCSAHETAVPLGIRDSESVGIYQNGNWHIPEWKVEYPKMDSGIHQNGKWQMPKWKVAYTRMESGISQNGKWYIPEWKVEYAKMESGIYQSGKWHHDILEWHIPNLYVKYVFPV